jgi:hypothetical protein
VSLVAAFGCSTSDEETDDSGDNSEGALVGKGSIDSAAVVEATTIMLVTDITGYGLTPVAPPIDLTLDPYNQADPFAIDSAQFRDHFARNLVKFDRIDGKEDWSTAQAATWVARMASGNYLVVDTSKPCAFDDPHTYLEIERAQLTGREYTTCGGRMPNEDALDVTLNFLSRGPSASAQDDEALSDGVESATSKATSTFPYLAEMNGLL